MAKGRAKKQSGNQETQEETEIKAIAAAPTQKGAGAGQLDLGSGKKK